MLPKLIEIGGFFLPTYGVMVALAFLTAIWMTGRLANGAGLNREKTTNLAIYCAIAGMAGAKLFMFLFDWRMYAADPGQLFTLSTLQAAGVYQGGLLLAIVTAVFYMRRQNMPVLLTCDVFSPGLALGHAIGRLGCFAAGCCWGTECDAPWAVTFRNPDANELTGVPLGVPLHPSQLYESAGNVALFGFLLWYFRRVPREGAVLGWYLVLYSLLRFAVEFVRHHDQALVSGLSLTQWISVATFCAGVWLLIRRPAFMTPETARRS